MENNFFFNLLAKQLFANGNDKDKMNYLKSYNELLSSIKSDKNYNSCPAILNIKPMSLEDLEKKFNN